MIIIYITILIFLIFYHFYWYDCTKPRKYICVLGVLFLPLFFDFFIGLWNCSGSVVFICFSFLFHYTMYIQMLSIFIHNLFIISMSRSNRTKTKITLYSILMTGNKWYVTFIRTYQIVRKDMDVNEHDRQSNFTLLLLFYISQSQQGLQ
jgi:hypothetical protein